MKGQKCRKLEVKEVVSVAERKKKMNRKEVGKMIKLQKKKKERVGA
jgi:hypothetical protein